MPPRKHSSAEFGKVELLKAIREQRQQLDLKDEQLEATPPP